ncbi:MAG: ArsA family ATPase [Myxococcota bacterium]|nr:ArsA family ATPase [Myxococcota bacterium]
MNTDEPIPNHEPLSQTGPVLRRFNLVTGKGGVGKSTVVATLGLRSARSRQRTLLIELNTGGQVAHCFGVDDGQGEIQQLDEYLWHVNIKPTLAMREYGLMKLKFDTAYRLVFENPIVRALVEFMPGLNDLLMLGKAFHHEREVDNHGEHVWDCIIVDAPATGHSLTFFRLPKMIRDVVPTGNMHRETDQMWSLLQDETRTVIHLVTLPEELPVQETIELCETLDDALKLPVGSIIINRFPTIDLDSKDIEAIESLDMAPMDELLRPMWTITRTAMQQHLDAQRHVTALNHLEHPLYMLPELVEMTLGRAAIQSLEHGLGR